MTGDEILRELLLERLIVLGAVFAGLVILVILIGWVLRSGRR